MSEDNWCSHLPFHQLRISLKTFGIREPEPQEIFLSHFQTNTSPKEMRKCRNYKCLTNIETEKIIEIADGILKGRQDKTFGIREPEPQEIFLSHFQTNTSPTYNPQLQVDVIVLCFKGMIIEELLKRLGF